MLTPPDITEGSVTEEACTPLTTSTASWGTNTVRSLVEELVTTYTEDSRKLLKIKSCGCWPLKMLELMRSAICCTICLRLLLMFALTADVATAKLSTAIKTALTFVNDTFWDEVNVAIDWQIAMASATAAAANSNEFSVRAAMLCAHDLID
jgi:hypothetical protein